LVRASTIKTDQSELSAPLGALAQIGDPGDLLRKQEDALELCESMIDIAAVLFNVPSKEIRRPGKTQFAVSRVRQIAMYVAHVALQLNFAEIGRGFGRDRSTVQHACHTVEDLRDDAEFDIVIARIEQIATVALRNRIGR
jgi:chromosomal replication initiation ATPase DnaA